MGLISIDNLMFLDKMLYITISLCLALSSLLFFRTHQYFKKLKKYYYSYYISCCFEIASLITYFITMNYNWSQYNLHRYIAGISFLFFFYSTIVPLMKYKEGLKINIPKKIAIPYGGSFFEIELKNLTKELNNISVEFKPPKNVYLTNERKKFTKNLILNPAASTFIKIKLSPLVNNQKKQGLIHIKSELVGERLKNIEVVT